VYEFGDCNADIYWTVSKVEGETITPFTDFSQPGTTNLKIEPGTLDPGEYVVCLEMVFTTLGPEFWDFDCMMIAVYLPELFVHIDGGEDLEWPHGDLMTVDASLSKDLVGNLSFVETEPLVAYWSFTFFESEPNDKQWAKFLTQEPTVGFIPSGNNNSLIQPGTDYALEVQTSMFPVGTRACAMLTLSRGNRVSSAFQCYKFVTGAIPLKIA